MRPPASQPPAPLFRALGTAGEAERRPRRGPAPPAGPDAGLKGAAPAPTRSAAWPGGSLAGRPQSRGRTRGPFGQKKPRRLGFLEQRRRGLKKTVKSLPNKFDVLCRLWDPLPCDLRSTSFQSPQWRVDTSFSPVSSKSLPTQGFAMASSSMSSSGIRKEGEGRGRSPAGRARLTPYSVSLALATLQDLGGSLPIPVCVCQNVVRSSVKARKKSEAPEGRDSSGQSCQACQLPGQASSICFAWAISNPDCGHFFKHPIAPAEKSGQLGL